MKKLLVLMLVLGMASLANAGPVASIDKLVIGINEDAVITLDAVADAGLQDYLSYIDVMGAAGGFSLATANGAALGDLGMIVGPYDIDGGVEIEITRAMSTGTAPYGTLATVTFTGLAEGLYDVVLYDWRDESIVSSQTITVTPEPATLAILGLGALLLRRK
jgi:hypothetical protein